MRHFQRPRAVDRCCLRLHACVAVWKEGVGLLGIIHAHALTHSLPHTLPHTLPHSLTFISHLSPCVPCCCCLLLNPHPQHTHSHTHSHTRTHTHALTHTHSHPDNGVSHNPESVPRPAAVAQLRLVRGALRSPRQRHVVLLRIRGLHACEGMW